MSKQFSILHLALLSAPAATLPWWDPVEEPGGLTCDFRPQQQLKIGEDREEVCMELGQAICRDNGDPLEFWQFGILDRDEKLVLLDPNGKAVYKDLPGATALCFGEDDYGGFHFGGAFPFQPSPPQPYLYVFDDCNQEILAELICHDIPDENREEPTTLKMTDNTDIGDNLYDPVNMVKFRKGRTEDRTDDNLLWGIDVDFKNHPLDGQIVANNEFCEWKEYYSSARCASNNCGLVDCCDVYEDNTYVFPFCEGSDFCEDLLSTTVIDRVEITLDGICEDLGINEAGTYDLSDTRIFGSKTSLNRALKNYFDALIECEEGSPNECVSNDQPVRGQSQSSSDPRLDTSFTEIFEFEQEEDCFPSSTTNTRRRLARRQKSKGRFNRGRRGNNRRRRRRTRRRTRRRSRVLTEMLTKNKMLRRALSENKCPPSLGGFFKAEGFSSVNDGTSDADPIFVVQISDPVDCSNPSSAVCEGTDNAFSCCGINNCKCGNVIDTGRCESLGCDISTRCCTEFPDVCGSSSFCTSLTPAPTPAPTPQPTPQPTGPIGPCTSTVDVCIALDESGSVDVGEYDLSKDFAIEFIDQFELQAAEASYGYVVFSFSAQTIVPNPSDANTTKNAIENRNKGAGTTNTAGAISECVSSLDNANSTEKVLLLVTDGQANSQSAASAAAEAARNDNIIVIPVGVGDGITESNLADWGGCNAGEDCYLSVDDFDDLPGIVMNITVGICA